MSVGLVAAGATVVSGIMGADAAGDAAAAQAASADRAAQLQKEQFDKQVELQEPFRQAGLAAQNRLLTLLGLEVPGGMGGMGGSSTPRKTLEQFRAELASAGGGGAMGALPEGYARIGDPLAGWFNKPAVDAFGRAYYFGGGDSGEMVRWPEKDINLQQPSGDLDARAKALFDAQEQGFQQQQAAQSANRNDPAFGSLMRDFGMSDFQADPGYAFRQSEGMKALQRSAAARGGLLSGGAAKDTLRFSQGLASDEYGRAFDRFQVNRSNKLNPLQSLAGVGQTSANTIGQAGQTYATNAGNAIMSGGNARASGYVGKANAITGAIGSGVNMYQQNQLLNSLRQPQPWNSPSSGMFAGAASGDVGF